MEINEKRVETRCERETRPGNQRLMQGEICALWKNGRQKGVFQQQQLELKAGNKMAASNWGREDDQKGGKSQWGWKWKKMFQWVHKGRVDRKWWVLQQEEENCWWCHCRRMDFLRLGTVMAVNSAVRSEGELKYPRKLLRKIIQDLSCQTRWGCR